MITVKIKSNPYLKKTEFFVWEDGWRAVTVSSDPNSKLLSKEISSGFLPFKIAKIIDLIMKEYRGGGEKIGLRFDGPEDEFRELESVCASDKYANDIVLAKGDMQLANARDILPEIKRVFRGIQPLLGESIMENPEIQLGIDKFIDASSDAIPICILGNYSAGKSTFINALIGRELLPNGDEPVTAKVFQIKRSRQQDRATIRFSHGADRIELRFDESGMRDADAPEGDEVVRQIAEELAYARDDSMITHMNKALVVVNDFERDTEDEVLSDLIEIEVPFNLDDRWGQSNEFVIFDTPGSNSVSNERHLYVLRKAMGGLSNGLPIYVCEKNSLDTGDNVRLYDEISKIDAIDSRFAMIVVNKADSADLQKGGLSEGDLRRIMSSAIPRRLYAQGIYFVSSVLGLGAKTAGEFISDNYAEKFEAYERMYTDSSSRFYKTLYSYNIQPEQILERNISRSESCDNLLLANSGLYCVENDIDMFAEKYSVYNKCQQSEHLLNSAIRATGRVLDEAREKREKSRADRLAALERDKRDLIERMEGEGDAFKDRACRDYPQHMEEAFESGAWDIDIESLRQREGEIEEVKRAEVDYGGQNKAAEDAVRSVGDNFVGRIREAWERKDIASLSDLVPNLMDDLQLAKERRDAFAEAGRSAERDTATDLLEETRRKFNDSKGAAKAAIDEESKRYWEAATGDARQLLLDIVTNSSVLAEEKRQELAKIIIQYQSVDFPGDSDEIFVKADLLQDFRLFNFVIFSTERLDLQKLAETFNGTMGNLTSEYKALLRSSHQENFRMWLRDLLESIVANITDYNPVLHNHAEIIRDDERRIAELSAKIDRLQECAERVAKMMEWTGTGA